MALAPLLHVGHSLGLSSWHLEPTIIAGSLIVLGLYIYQSGRVAEALDEWRIFAFLCGWLAMFLALASPLDGAAHRLLSMHMLQHVLLTTVGPPLVLLGLPPPMLEPLLRRPRLAVWLGRVTNPAFTGALFIVNMWFWHVPPVYQTALNHLSAHILMHVLFMATGVLFWWPVLKTVPNRVSEGARLLYLFVTGFPMELQALLLLASGGVIYSYYEDQTGFWGLSAIEDQQIAGLIMGAMGQIAAFIAITWLFFRYLDREAVEVPPSRPGPVDAG
ncbi:MAG TPA: cytochrome c oxidase assembly protein [Dehalococcoidia bacterium]|nr:cytochrome c oxidase assembly protein [Dehalococcoidia bacterium]